MKKQPLFQFIDLVIYFNIIIFIAGGFSSVGENKLLTFTFFGIGISNLLFVLGTIKLRIDYNVNFYKKIELEIKSEEKLENETKENFNAIKQRQLETRVESVLLDKIPNAKIIRNAYIPAANGNESEIDVLLICELGIFIIECKNITGEINAEWKSDYITVNHPGGKSYQIQNPINQNTEHFKRLRNLLGMKNDYFRSIVVFGDHSYIKNYRGIPYHAAICNLDSLLKSVEKLAKRYGEHHLELHMVETIYNNLYQDISKTDEKAINHKARLQEKYKKDEQN